MCYGRTVAVLAAVLGLATAACLADGTGKIVKWSQPPVEVAPGMIYGWDQASTVASPIVADDFMCDDLRPVTDLHWWGSYLGYLGGGTQAPPVQPSGFLIRFWTDVPAGVDPLMPWSHPGNPIWGFECRSYTEQPHGQDIDVVLYEQQGLIQPVDQCFQYNQTLKPGEYFYQDPGTIYWLSIQAMWDAGIDPNYVWGWKTRPNYFNDDAVTGMLLPDGGGISWEEITLLSTSWDMTYELTVPEPATMCLLGLGAVGLLARRRRK